MEWKTRIRKLFRKLLLQLGQCDLCGEATDQHTLLCAYCLAEIPTFEHEVTQGDLLNWPAINRALPNISFDHLFCLSPFHLYYIINIQIL